MSTGRLATAIWLFRTIYVEGKCYDNYSKTAHELKHEIDVTIVAIKSHTIEYEWKSGAQSRISQP